MMTPVINGAGGTSSRGASGSSENPWDTIQQIVAGTIGTKIQGRHIGNYHLANQLFLASQKLGKDMGLSEEIMRQIMPFPAHPANNTVVINENPAMAELLAKMMAAQPPVAPVATPAKPPAPAPAEVAATVPTWKRFVWPAIAAAGLATAGGTAVALWPEDPAPLPPVNADYEVTAR